MSPDPSEAVIDRLELELRQLRGVSFVAFSERPMATLVEIAVEPGVDAEALHAEASRVVRNHIEGEVVVEVVDGVGVGSDRAGLRVQLLVTVSAAGGASVEIHMAHQGRRATVEAHGEDRLAVAEAVVGGLGVLGLPVPYAPVAAHELGADLGSGTLVLLRDHATGDTRRGLASGRSPAESTARAVLDALNRFLQTARTPA